MEGSAPGRGLQFQRFTRLDLTLHALLIVSFIALALTGMSLKFSYTGWASFLSRRLGGFESAGFIHRAAAVFKSNTPPGNTDTLATYTEADFTGYSAATLTGGSWVVTGNPITYAKQTFTSSAGSQNQDVYGYYLKAGTDLIYAERFTDGPYNIANNGDKIEVTPSLGADLMVLCGMILCWHVVVLPVNKPEPKTRQPVKESVRYWYA